MWIETSRLYIYQPHLQDLNDLYVLQSDPTVMHYIGTGVRDMPTVEKSLHKAIKHFAQHGFSLGSVFEKHSGRFIGRAGLIYLEFEANNQAIEIGYALHAAYWGLGYGTELARALIAWGFKHLSCDKLVGIVQPQNTRSAHVLMKAGMYYKKDYMYQGVKTAYYEIARKAWIT